VFKKCWKKIRRKKGAKKIFIFTRMSLPKYWGGKTCLKVFHKRTNSASKKFWEKNRRKKCEKSFLYSHECRDQKNGEKKVLNIFP